MHQPRYYKLQRTDRDDQARAVIFDQWLERQARDTVNQCVYYLFTLTDKLGLSEVGAKSLLACLFGLIGAHVDERDNLEAKGEAIRAAFEWENLLTMKVEV